MSNLAYHHSSPRQAYLSLEEKSMYEAKVEKRIQFINRTHQPLTICERSNLRYTLPPSPLFNKEHEFIFRVEYFFNTEKVRNNTQLLLDGLRNISEDLKVFLNAFATAKTVRLRGGIEFTVEYAIPIRVLEDLGGLAYFKEIDVVISSGMAEECPNHPFSQENENSPQLRSVIDENAETSFAINIMINDPHQHYGVRFINIGGEVYRLKNIGDFKRRSGVSVNRYVEGRLEHNFYSFEEADSKLHLFRTEDEAKFNGNTDVIVRRELVAAEHANLEMKRELESARTRLQVEETEFKRLTLVSERRREELESLRAEVDHARALQQASIKDHYEERSYQRKDSSEGMKMIPAIVVGIGALFMGIKNLFG